MIDDPKWETFKLDMSTVWKVLGVVSIVILIILFAYLVGCTGDFCLLDRHDGNNIIYRFIDVNKIG